eukprot:CAMPEP_0117528890 /NCGR_PEP_ID=MMETSP0784-20121206/37550_1 /TAXON_ID=39447 /ORGANISM="" /LENGTH=328 /DNA_ID=CAMNT_0005325195 /DNA_START=57 /DNA_END=1041 /DNA_ORIENTATION=-
MSPAMATVILATDLRAGPMDGGGPRRPSAAPIPRGRLRGSRGAPRAATGARWPRHRKARRPSTPGSLRRIPAHVPPPLRMSPAMATVILATDLRAGPMDGGGHAGHQPHRSREDAFAAPAEHHALPLAPGGRVIERLVVQVRPVVFVAFAFQPAGADEVLDAVYRNGEGLLHVLPRGEEVPLRGQGLPTEHTCAMLVADELRRVGWVVLKGTNVPPGHKASDRHLWYHRVAALLGLMPPAARRVRLLAPTTAPTAPTNAATAGDTYAVSIVGRGRDEGTSGMAGQASDGDQESAPTAKRKYDRFGPSVTRESAVGGGASPTLAIDRRR